MTPDVFWNTMKGSGVPAVQVNEYAGLGPKGSDVPFTMRPTWVIPLRSSVTV